MGSIATVILDDVDVTPYAIEGSVNLRLNRVSQAQFKINMEALADIYGSSIPGCGVLARIYFQTDASSTPVLYHHGRVMTREITATDDTGYAVFNTADPLELWTQRPVRDDDGDFSNPLLIDTYLYGTQIVERMVLNSENAGLGPPSDAEGPTFLSVQHIDAGVTPLKGAPKDWPMTMAELASLLVSTNTVDIIVTPIELDVDGNYGQLDLYNGDYGVDRTASVILQYGFGAFNVKSLRWNEDMSQMCNKLWYYLGPKIDTQHWAGNITGDDPAFNPDATQTGAWAATTGYIVGDVATNGGNSYAVTHPHTASAINEPGVGADWPQFWTFWAVPPGGRLAPPASTTDNIIGADDATSRDFYGVRMDIQIFDGSGDDHPNDGRELYQRRWQEEQYLRSRPRTIVHVTPNRDTEIGSFGIGDLITVEADTLVAGGFSGGQRVYEYTISWDEDSVPAIGELQVSSDNEGFSA